MLGIDFVRFDDYTPREINLKIGYYVKQKIEKDFAELSRICTLINVHLSKRNQQTPEKIYKKKKEEEYKKNMTPEEKAEMLKGMFSGGNTTTEDFMAKKKAEKAIAELKRQGKLK